MSNAFMEKPPSFVEQSATLLDALANVSRMTVLDLLSGGEMSVGSLSQRVGLSQSALSQHLAKLRGAGLVKTRREAQTIYYSCTSEPVHHVLSVLRSIFEEPAATAEAS